jgi:nitrogen fixation/metabolism regulation signal transduction histidine kinase
VRVFSNPIFLHGAAILFCSSFAFVLGIVLMRLLRKSIQEEADISSDSPTLESLPLHTYNTVIRQLKQQQADLKAQSQAEQQRSRTTERFAEAVFSNLSCGLLSVGKNGLIKSSNPAAKQILGFASPAGMSVKDIFRSATVSIQSAQSSPDAEIPTLVSGEFDSVLRSGSGRREIQAEYLTPSGESRILSIAMVPVLSSDGSATAVACLISDTTELTRLRNEIASHARPIEASIASSRAVGAGV